MIYRFDTNAVSDLMTEHPRLRSRMAAMAMSDRAVICPVVRGEILHGIERLPAGKRRSDLGNKAQRAFAVLACETISEAVGDHYATLRTECESRGASIHENDLWIAATASNIGAIVVSRDRDLSRVSGIQVEDWTL
jgi:predicted nucleic acid-binding protein